MALAARCRIHHCGRRLAAEVGDRAEGLGQFVPGRLGRLVGQFEGAIDQVYRVAPLVVRGNTRTSSHSTSALVSAGRDGIVPGRCAGTGMSSWWSGSVRPTVVARVGDSALPESA
jgi:hypothetical protein